MSQFKVLSQLMQNHRLAAPVTGNSQIAAARDGSGQVSAFSIGSSGRVYQVYPDATSDTDWSVRDLAYPGTATALAAYPDNDGTITLVAADGKTGIHQLIVPASTATSLPGWTSLPSIAARSIAIGMTPGGWPGVCVYASDYNIYWLQIVNGAYTWGKGLRTTSPLTPIAAWTFAQVYDTDDWSGPYTGAVWTPESPGTPSVALFSRGWWLGSGYGCQANGTFTAVSAFPNGQGRFDVFAINSADSGVYYLQAPVAGPGYEFLATQISGSIPASAVVAGHYVCNGGSGGTVPCLEAFILDTSGHLCLATQQPPPATGWDDCIALDDQLQFTRICSALTGVGNSEVFAIATDGSLYHVWQDPESTDWNFDLIEVAFDGQLEDVPTYQTIVTGTDASGQPLVYAAASVAAVNGDSVYLEINGQQVIVGATTPWTGTTDAKGSLVISQSTSALASPVLQVTIAGVPSIPPLDASGTVQATLGTVTGQQLIDEGVLATQYQDDANAVASALQQAMAMVPPAASPTAFDEHPGSTMATLSGNGGRARASAQAWSYDVSSGRPVFSLLTDAEADAAIAKARALPPLVGGFFSSLEDAWGDVVSAVKHGAATLQSWIVKAGQVTLTLLVDGAQWVYSSVVNLVEDALDLAEQIFTTVQVFFTNLFDWLGFIFNWQNILRTQQAVVYAVGQVLDFIQQAAGTIQQKFDANLQNFVNTQLASAFSQAESLFGVNSSFGQYQSQAQQQPVAGLDAPPAQLMTNHLLQKSAAASSTPSATGVAGVAGAAGSADALGSVSSTLQGIVDKINGLSTTYGTNQKLQDAQDFLTAAMASPDQFPQLALNGLFAAVEAAILAVFEGIQFIVDAVLSAVQAIVGALQAVFATTWDIPVLSQIWARMTTSSGNPNGLPLSALSLLGLLIAAPATVVYSAATGAAPFPDDASVTAFEASFTASTLLANSGLGSTAPSPVGNATAVVPATTRAAAGVGDSNPLPTIFAYCHAATLAITAFAEPLLDLQLPTGVSPGSLSKFSPSQEPDESYESLATANLLFEVAGVVFSIPWVAGPQPWATNNQAAWGSYGWLGSVVKMGADGTFYYLTKKLPRQMGDAGTFFEVVWGFLEVIPPVMQTYCGGTVAGVAGIVQSIGDMGRIARIKDFVIESEGVSLLVIACADFVGNMAQAGLTIASAYVETPAATPALAQRAS